MLPNARKIEGTLEAFSTKGRGETGVIKFSDLSSKLEGPGCAFDSKILCRISQNPKLDMKVWLPPFL